MAEEEEDERKEYEKFLPGWNNDTFSWANWEVICVMVSGWVIEAHQEKCKVIPGGGGKVKEEEVFAREWEIQFGVPTIRMGLAIN